MEFCFNRSWSYFFCKEKKLFVSQRGLSMEYVGIKCFVNPSLNSLNIMLIFLTFTVKCITVSDAVDISTALCLPCVIMIGGDTI